VEGAVNESVLTGGQPERERTPGKHARSIKREDGGGGGSKF
jgi:hypothetical protein